MALDSSPFFFCPHLKWKIWAFLLGFCLVDVISGWKGRSFCLGARFESLDSYFGPYLRLYGYLVSAVCIGSVGVVISDISPRRRSERLSVTENRMLDSLVPASIVKFPLIKKIVPRKTQPASASTKSQLSLQQIIHTGSSLRRSPRISPKTGKENATEKSSKQIAISSSEPNLAPSLLLCHSSSRISCNAEPKEKKILSPVCDSESNKFPSLDARDDIMSKKVRRSYSRLDASFGCSSFKSPSSQGNNSDTSTPNHSHPKRRSFFGFEKLLATEVLVNVSPVPVEKQLLEQTAAETTVVATDLHPEVPDTDIPGIVFGKEKKKRRKVPQIAKSDLDEWAAQMNAEFDEAEKFNLLVE
uniref:Sororin isoform X2 n=1 Tax=Geotrypetes seraphini TaxID=260995 RepID=A0A6P8S381_GEOSA|nr:sororin isoform X2 [Geotrypetes seraphini]